MKMKFIGIFPISPTVDTGIASDRCNRQLKPNLPFHRRIGPSNGELGIGCIFAEYHHFER